MTARDKINIHMHLFQNFCFQLGNCPLYVPNITSQADKIMSFVREKCISDILYEVCHCTISMQRVKRK